MPTYVEWKCKERMRYGHMGSMVARVQATLKEANFHRGSVDGKFGVATEGAVRDFQGFNGYTIDGIIGPVTAGALDGGWGMSWSGCKPV